MTLKQRISDDMKAAMRAKEADRLLAIRNLMAAMKQREVDERIVLDDVAVVAIVDKLIKQRKDSLSQFTAAGRMDLADKEAAEIKMIEAYLPKAMGEEEITAAVKATIAEMGSPTMKDVGTVMKNAMVKLQATGARVEGKTVSEIVKKQLGG